MRLLYSNVLPLGMQEGDQTIVEAFYEQMSKADAVEIAVEYVSAASLKELDAIMEEQKIKKIILTLGMYYTEGMPESTYRLVRKLNDKWRKAGTGEIRLTTRFEYHGNLYCFYRDGEPFSAILGSADLSVLKPDADALQQHDISLLIMEPAEVHKIADHISGLQMSTCSSAINQICAL